MEPTFDELTDELLNLKDRRASLAVEMQRLLDERNHIDHRFSVILIDLRHRFLTKTEEVAQGGQPARR